jgi:hypothetical protein
MKLGFKRKFVKVWPLRTLKLFIFSGGAKKEGLNASTLITLLAQYQVNATEFCEEFNERSLDIYLEDIEIPVVLWRTPHSTEFVFKFPTAGWLVAQMLQLEAEEIFFEEDLNELEFDFEEEFNLNLVLKSSSSFFNSITEKISTLFHPRSSRFRDLEEYNLKRITFSYIYLWDLSWFNSGNLGLTCAQSASYILGTIKPFRSFIRIEYLSLIRVHKLFKRYDFLRIRRRWYKNRKKKIFVALKKLRFDSIIYKFYNYLKNYKVKKFIGSKIYNFEKRLLIIPFFTLQRYTYLNMYAARRIFKKLYVFKRKKYFQQQICNHLKLKYKLYYAYFSSISKTSS